MNENPEYLASLFLSGPPVSDVPGGPVHREVGLLRGEGPWLQLSRAPTRVISS